MQWASAVWAKSIPAETSARSKRSDRRAIGAIVLAVWRGIPTSFLYARAMRGRGVTSIAVLLGLLAAAPAAVAAPAPTPKEPLFVPDGFRVPATNGYTLDVYAQPPAKGTRGTVLLFVTARGREVTYAAPARITETSIRASLGEVGEISVEFQRSDRPATTTCAKKKIQFDSGSWVGTIDFHGEEGFAAAEATSARGEIDYELGPFCGGLETGGGGPRKGADLEVRNPALGPRLSVFKPRPGAAASIVVRVTEYDDGISIERALGVAMPGRDFSYDPRLRKALVAPPGPFSGTARFDSAAKGAHRWSGDLSVDMPGRSEVRLTGPLLRASLSPD
jgi:hypothetical protein